MGKKAQTRKQFNASMSNLKKHACHSKGKVMKFHKSRTSSRKTKKVKRLGFS